MKAKVGYYVTLVCKGRGGFMQTIDVPITGIVQTENPVINASATFMDLAYLDYMLELEGAVTEYSLDLGNLTIIDSQYKKLNSLASALPEGIEMYSWRDISASYIAYIEAESGISNIMVLIICLIAAVGITNTILMAVMERKKEIGALMSLGMEAKHIKNLFLLESTLLSFIASLAGIVIAFIIVNIFGHTGINMLAMMGGDEATGLGISAWLYSTLRFDQSLILLFMGTSVATIACILPARMALQVQPSEALRSAE